MFIDVYVTARLPPRADALLKVAQVLSELDLADIPYVRPSDTQQRINVADLLA
jgi:hypothetical protein